ncbi:MAG TPA: sulfur carrier protein ThiS [Alphaproteobacteria bacterium]|jgi:sulfur carrier protein|nr:sulfur carrier protein ThiS [Alphaproteobacteria bacterium]
MDICLNGAPHRFDGSSLIELLAAQAIDESRKGVAVAINEEIVPRAEWATAVLKSGDTVEIVRPHSGG